VLQAEFQGYRLGVRANDDQVYVSKINDPQAQHPNDVIGVSRGVGGEIRSISRFATNCVVQKASRTYRLKGDRMPFIPDEVHTTFGNVGAESAVEVQGRFYCWDEQQGPYWTDLNLRWVPIATAAIENLVQSVPATFAKDIQCVYVKFMKTVFFSVPTNVVGRRRVLIGWHTDFQSWLPPITGLEYAAIATFLDPNGDVSLFVADYWGRLYQYFTDLVEGVPSGSLIARVASATSGTVTCDFEQSESSTGVFSTTTTPVAFYTTGDGLKGLPVLHVDRNGTRQWRRIQSNTGSVITLDTTNDSPWANIPQAGEQIVVGGIDWYWRSPLVDYGEPLRKKRGGFLEIEALPGSANFATRVVGLLEGYGSRTWSTTLNFLNTGALWGVGAWGVMVWGGGTQQALKFRLMRTFFKFAIELANPYPNRPVTIQSLRIGADPLRGQTVPSGGS
jgi:hypothetical protein